MTRVLKDRRVFARQTRVKTMPRGRHSTEKGLTLCEPRCELGASHGQGTTQCDMQKAFRLGGGWLPVRNFIQSPRFAVGKEWKAFPHSLYLIYNNYVSPRGLNIYFA